ncbi:MAG: hypothetical protein Q8S33_11115 [Myxococcales bacterium]|nr:hypothetical protein [Myxococcales bacterium]MDP3500878.1 hypothetical protein [Myxococcales bacterium]
MSVDRELRNLVEKLQSENQALRRQLLELEEVATELAATKDANEALRRQLELADEVRDTWHRNATRLRRELAIAREEQLRLRRVIDDERLEHRRQLKKLKKA